MDYKRVLIPAGPRINRLSCPVLTACHPLSRLTSLGPLSLQSPSPCRDLVHIPDIVSLRLRHGSPPRRTIRVP